MAPSHLCICKGLTTFPSFSPPSCHSFSGCFLLLVHAACTSCFAGGRVISHKLPASYITQSGGKLPLQSKPCTSALCWDTSARLVFGKGLPSVQVNHCCHLERKCDNAECYDLDTPEIPSETFAILSSSQARRGRGSNEGSWTEALHTGQAFMYRPQNLHSKPLTNEVKEKSGIRTKSGCGLNFDSRAAGAAWRVIHSSAVPNTLC